MMVISITFVLCVECLKCKEYNIEKMECDMLLGRGEIRFISQVLKISPDLTHEPAYS